MAVSKLFEALLRAAKSAEVRRVAADALLALVVIVARLYGSFDDDQP